MAYSSAGHGEGVCAGIAHYLDVPVKLVRIPWCCQSFWSGLFTFVAYIVLTFVLDPMPDNVVSGEQQPSSGELLDAVDRELAASEKRLREMERYVTSDTFPYVVVSANCEVRNEQSLATCRAKG